ncbi:hypothetical protein D9M72_521770 [compost metagenome]
MVQRCLVYFGQSLDQLDPSPRRIQRQEDDDRGFLVHACKTGDQIDEQAFRVGPGVVELSDQEKDVVKSRHGHLPSLLFKNHSVSE